MFCITPGQLLKRLGTETEFKEKFMADYGPRKVTRMVMSRDASGELVLGFDSSATAGPIGDGVTEIIKVGNVVTNDGTAILVKHQAFTQKVGEVTIKEWSAIKDFYADYLKDDTDVFAVAMADTDLDDADSTWLASKDGDFTVAKLTGMLNDFVCLGDGKVHVLAHGKTAVIDGNAFAKNVADGGNVLAAADIIRAVGNAKLVRMPKMSGGKRLLGYVRPDHVLVVMNADLKVLDNKPLEAGKIATVSIPMDGTDDTVIVFGKPSVNVDEYTLMSTPPVNFFGQDTLANYGQAASA